MIIMIEPESLKKKIQKVEPQPRFNVIYSTTIFIASIQYKYWNANVQHKTDSSFFFLELILC